MNQNFGFDEALLNIGEALFNAYFPGVRQLQIF